MIMIDLKMFAVDFQIQGLYSDTWSRQVDQVSWMSKCQWSRWLS